jgi:type II secretory pathway predicted ATPase ExeA/cell division septation protein DedD
MQESGRKCRSWLEVACHGGGSAPIDAYDMSQWKGYSPDNVLVSGAAAADIGPQSAISAGALTYEPYFGLTGKPFSLSTDPRALYKSPSHAAVLDALLAGIRRREGIIVLTGEMGTGKTTLCRAALYQLDRKTFTTFVPDPSLSREDLLRMLLVDFGEVSIDDLRRGRLSGAPRPDLSYQLYEFLTSLESVDAFAVLVIDEAQRLAMPLLEEIRALSELEAGRRLLQIVLVGQPELQTRLKQFQMRHIDQRVTMRCELQSLTKEDVANYAAHRLAMVGGTSERIAFASAAIDLIHAASNGIPRIVNIICDRALTRAHLERVSVVGPPLVAEAVEELQLVSSQVAVAGQVVERTPVRPAQVLAPAPPAPTPRERESVPVPPPPPSVPSNLKGLFDRRQASPEAPAVPSELHSLLTLQPTAPRREWETAPDHVKAGAGPSAAPVWKWRVDSEVRREARFGWLKNAGLAALGMGVLLLAGGIAVTAQRGRLAFAAPVAAPAAVRAATSTAPATAPQTRTQAQTPVAVAAATPVSADTWVVQVAAFTTETRARGLVQRLLQSGFPAFEVPSLGGDDPLYFVRVGPFKTASEADEVRDQIRQLSDLEDAFVRSVTTK